MMTNRLIMEHSRPRPCNAADAVAVADAGADAGADADRM